jgi:hypothetical protein
MGAFLVKLKAGDREPVFGLMKFATVERCPESQSVKFKFGAGAAELRQAFLEKVADPRLVEQVAGGGEGRSAIKASRFCT